MTFGQCGITQRRSQKADPHPRLSQGCVVGRQSSIDDCPDRLSCVGSIAFDRIGAFPGSLVQDIPCMQKQRPFVRERVEDESGGAAGALGNRPQSQACRAFFGQRYEHRL